MDTNTQIERLIELAIVQRTELKRLVEELPQLKEHLSAEIERTFEETEPQLRAELEEWTSKQAADKTAALGAALESKIASLAKSLEESAQAKFSAVLAARDQNAELLKQAEDRIAAAAGELPEKVKEIVTAELARFPRAGEIDQLRKEFQEPRGLNPRGKWLPDQTYNKLDLVTWNGDSYVSNTDGNKERPGRNAANWTLSAARGTSGGGPADLSALTAVPSNGELLIGSGTSWVNGTLSAGAGISITVGPGAITISATDGDITLDDGTAASPSLHFTNDADTGIYRPAANTLGISVSGTQVAYFDENGLTVPSAGVVAGGSIHASNGNANNPSLSFSSDQDTGFFRHAANEIGIALGGTQYATLTSTTFSITPVVTMASSLRVNGTTDSTNKDTGAIVTEGGLGVEKSATIGGNLTVSGTTSSITLGSTNTGSIAVDTNGGLTISPKSGQGVGVGGAPVGTVKLFAKGDTSGTGTFTFLLRNSSDLNLMTVRDDGFINFQSGQAIQTAGNLTVNGTGTNTFSGPIRINASASAPTAGSFSTSAGNGLEIWPKSGSSYDLLVYTAAGSSLLSVPSGTNNLTLSGNLTVSGGTITSGTGTLTLNSSANTVVLQSAGTTALTLDSSQTATFAGIVLAKGAAVAGSAGLATKGVDGATSKIGFSMQSGTSGRGTFIQLTDSATFNSAWGAEDDGSLAFYTGRYPSVAGTQRFKIDTSGNATFAGSIAINNTVQTAAAVASTHKVTISIGGVTYYLLATNV